MSKKIKFTIFLIVAIMFALMGKVSAYSADASLTTESKLVEGGQVEVILKMENINATESGISVVKGKISYDKDVFEGYTLETQNNWKEESSSDTFLFEKQTGITQSEQIAKIIFKVKEGITKTEAEIKFTNITASGITKQNGGPGDIKVAGATIKVSKTEAATITKENLDSGKNNKITTSKSNENKLPYAGAENFVFIGTILVLSTIFFYSRFRKFKDIK